MATRKRNGELVGAAPHSSKERNGTLEWEGSILFSIIRFLGQIKRDGPSAYTVRMTKIREGERRKYVPL